MTISKKNTQGLLFREARHSDLRKLVEMLSDDMLGATRDGFEHMPAYEAAFRDIQAQQGNTIIIAELDGEIVGMLQLTLIPGLSRAGMLRGQIESVRVSTTHRGQGIGKALFEHAIHRARTAGCGLVQLTSDKQRLNAHNFYDQLGFEASHEGYKLGL